MKNITMLFWLWALGSLCCTPLPVSASDGREHKATSPGVEGRQAETASQESELKGKDKEPAAHMPRYKWAYQPPLRGAPDGRLAGGTRGVEDASLFLSVLAPNHTGRTAQRQPALYWFLSQPTHHPLYVTIIETNAIRPILETEVAGSQQAGIQHIHLSDQKVRLQPGGRYEWFVSLVPDADHRSKDIISRGEIECVEVSETLRVKLKQMDLAAAVHAYGEEGLWYDALANISELIDAHPAERTLREQRACLLRQVELPEVAAYEMKQVTSPEER